MTMGEEKIGNRAAPDDVGPPYGSERGIAGDQVSGIEVFDDDGILLRATRRNRNPAAPLSYIYMDADEAYRFLEDLAGLLGLGLLEPEDDAIDAEVVDAAAPASEPEAKPGLVIAPGGSPEEFRLPNLEAAKAFAASYTEAAGDSRIRTAYVLDTNQYQVQNFAHNGVLYEVLECRS